jgi:competence protein ComEC
MNVNEYENTMIHCGNIDFYIYDLLYQDENENENSMIMSVFMANKHVLFVGDSEIKRETEFIRLYKVEVDILKVGHHGSDTSSSLPFLKSIQPKMAMIIVDRNNKFGHPSSEIINRYEELGINLYRTDKDGTIILRYFFGKEDKKVHSPT